MEKSQKRKETEKATSLFCLQSRKQNNGVASRRAKSPLHGPHRPIEACPASYNMTLLMCRSLDSFQLRSGEPSCQFNFLLLSPHHSATMEGRSSPPVSKSAKFAVYQNPSLTAALTAASLQPSKSTFLYILFLSSASALALFSLVSRENGFIEMVEVSLFSRRAAYLLTKAVEGVVGVVFFGCLFGLLRAISWKRVGNAANVPMITPSETKDHPKLTSRQLGLLGIRPKVEASPVEYSKRPPKSKPTPASDLLVPIHQQTTGSNIRSRSTSDKSSVGSGNKMASFGSPSKSQSSPSSMYLVPRISSPLPSGQSSPGMDSAVSTPWSSKRGSSAKEITTEEELEKFLADVNAKFTESAGKQTTPPPTVRGFGILSPGNVPSPTNTSGTTRSTPLRAVRMSPSSQKFSTPPKKGEGDLPPPMSMEEAIEAFKHLGIYPQIEQWRDRLRQWFSSVLLGPLVNKIKTSHIQVMQTAAELGVAITVNQVGNPVTSDTPATLSSIDGKEWQAAFTLDEDGRLHQLRANLVHAIDASAPKFNQFNKQQSPQQNPMAPVMQKCLDAITEHQKLRALMKGEWGKGTCVKNYEYTVTGEAYDAKSKKRTLDLPTDSHLLLYLFCAFVEHPKWMLHVDPSSHAGGQSSKNPLFLGVLPPKERFPEKYIAVVSAVPSTLHPGACVLVVGKQSPPVFALYWDKMQQFSLQGRTALWDSMIVMCHRIKVGYGGVVRGMHLEFLVRNQKKKTSKYTYLDLENTFILLSFFKLSNQTYCSYPIIMDLDEFVSWAPEKQKKTYFIRNGRMGRDKDGNMIIRENEEDINVERNSSSSRQGMVVLGIVVGLLLFFIVGNCLLYRYATRESDKKKKMMIKKAVSKKKMKRERLKQGIFVPGD
ncbi:hypothetical protein LINGRAHAP2_LOCUS26933 [Linum grandiflorum]